MSDTPRTIEEWRRLQRDETGRYSSEVTYGDLAHGMSAFAKQLERELAEVTKQRDELAEALEKIAIGEWCIKTCFDVIAPRALASVNKSNE